MRSSACFKCSIRVHVSFPFFACFKCSIRVHVSFPFFACFKCSIRVHVSFPELLIIDYNHDVSNPLSIRSGGVVAAID
jgi:hypothetical protein